MHDDHAIDAMRPPANTTRPYAELALAVIVSTLRPLATSRNPAARRKAIAWLKSDDGRFWLNQADVNADVLLERLERDGLPAGTPRPSWSFRNDVR